jgi:hypothetical protein
LVIEVLLILVAGLPCDRRSQDWREYPLTYLIDASGTAILGAFAPSVPNGRKPRALKANKWPWAASTRASSGSRAST